jgi:di/tricarboxylate transporter
MAFPELFTALQQGTVDGQENPIPVILASRFAQVQKHLSLTGHVYSPAVILLSPKVWDKLSDADKKAFVAAAQKGAEAQRKKVNDDENNGIAQLRKDGMQVVEKVDGDSFRKAVAPAYASLKSPAWFLLGVNAALFVIGMFIETSAAIIVLAPILVPVALHLGIDPVHFGMIMVVNLALGMITPPFGVNLFAACTVAQISLDRIVRHLSAFVAVVVGCLMVVTYVPALSLTLRDLVYAPAAPVLMPTPSASSAAPASIAPQ